MTRLHAHPMKAGFTARYERHGKQQVPVYRHCGEDARQGIKQFRGKDNVLYMVYMCSCEVCGLATVDADTYTLAKFDEACTA